MLSDQTSIALHDILRHIDLAIEFARGFDQPRFAADTRTLYAVIRCLEIISEASRRLPDALKQRHPQIAWRQMAGAGNVSRHDYEEIAARFVWNTVERDLPPLRRVIGEELTQFGQAW